MASLRQNLMSRLDSMKAERDSFETAWTEIAKHIKPRALRWIDDSPTDRGAKANSAIFDPAAMSAQRDLWKIQGARRTWFCGAYWGSGFHEDGIQAGLAAAEALGGVRRPWSVTGESDRIHLAPGRPEAAPSEETVG